MQLTSRLHSLFTIGGYLLPIPKWSFLADLGVNLDLRLCGGLETAAAQALDCLDTGRSGTRPGLETLAVIMDREPSRGRTLTKEVVMKHRIPITTLIAFLALLIAIPLSAAAFKGAEPGKTGPER